MFALFLIATASAAELHVPSDAYPTMQSAVDAAGHGDVVHVAAGPRTETVVIPAGKDLALVGAPGASLQCVETCLRIDSETKVRVQLDIVGVPGKDASIEVGDDRSSVRFTKLTLRGVSLQTAAAVELVEARLVEVSQAGAAARIHRSELLGSTLDLFEVRAFTHNTVVYTRVDLAKADENHHNLFAWDQEPSIEEQNYVGRVWFSDALGGDFRVAAGQPLADGYGAHPKPGPPSPPLLREFLSGAGLVGAAPDGTVLLRSSDSPVRSCPRLVLRTKERTVERSVAEGWLGETSCRETLAAFIGRARAAGVVPVHTAKPVAFASTSDAEFTTYAWFDHGARGFSLWRDADVLTGQSFGGSGTLYTLPDGSHFIEFMDQSGEGLNMEWVGAPPAPHCSGSLHGTPVTRGAPLRVWRDFNGVAARSRPLASSDVVDAYAEGANLVATGAVTCSVETHFIRGRPIRSRWVQVWTSADEDAEIGWVFGGFLVHGEKAGTTHIPLLRDGALSLGDRWLDPRTGRASDTPVEAPATATTTLAYEAEEGSGLPGELRSTELDITDRRVVVLKDDEPTGVIPGRDGAGWSGLQVVGDHVVRSRVLGRGRVYVECYRSNGTIAWKRDIDAPADME